MQPPDLVLRHARLAHAPGEWDVSITGGLVGELAPMLDATGGREIDLTGSLLVPGFVDAHVHLDKAFLWDDRRVQGTKRGECSAALREVKRASSSEDIHARMRRAVELASSHGTTTLRAQIEVDHLVALRGLEAAVRLRAECADRVDLQIVVFPQEGLLSLEGVPDLFRQAAGMGVCAIGGAPGFDAGVAAVEHLQWVFDLAREHDLDVDLHVDLSTPPERLLAEWEIFQAAALSERYGWHGRVSAAHLQTLSRMETPEPLLTLLREAGISVTTVPGAELYLARTWREPPARDARLVLTNLEALIQSGIPVSLATGHVRDPLNPYGNADPLSDAFLLSAALNLGDPTIGGQSILSLISPGEVASGQTADLVVLEANEPATAIRQHAASKLVLKAGRPQALPNARGL